MSLYHIQDSSSVTSGELIPVVRFQRVERELKAAKEEINDAAEQLEQKRRELRESLRREALVLQELQATQLCVQELQKEVHIFSGKHTRHASCAYAYTYYTHICEMCMHTHMVRMLTHKLFLYLMYTTSDRHDALSLTILNNAFVYQ